MVPVEYHDGQWPEKTAWQVMAHSERSKLVDVPGARAVVMAMVSTRVI